MEGVAGVAAWEQCVAGGDDYALGRELLTGEVLAATSAAIDAGATGIVVNDSHSAMRNLAPQALPVPVSYLSGRFKPRYMMEGLDETFDAAVFLGYHAAIATPGVLSHTYNPKAIAGVRLNGTTTGEAGINALVAQHFRVPVVVITGDQYVGPEAAPFCPGIRPVVVKESISRHAAHHLHPAMACERIATTVHDALSILDSFGPPSIALPATMEVDFASPDMAEQATWIRGVSRLADRTVSVTDDEPLRLFGAFITMVYLTRSLADIG
jgi:D-amino peptidase